MNEGPSAVDACCHENLYVHGMGETLDLAFPPLLTLPVVPPLPALAVALFTLTSLFPLVTFDEFLGSSMFVPLPLPMMDMAEAFMLDMEILISKSRL